MAGSTSTHRDPLDTAGIVAAAMAIADEEGVGALTMRKLAARLGYEVMSLYNHVANKAELQFLMVDAVAAEIDGAPSEARPVDGAPVDAAPLDAVRAMAISTHEALVRHPWAAELWLRHLPGPARTRTMDDLLRLLDESELPADLAHHGFHAVNNHVLGYTLQEQGMTLAQDSPNMAEEYLASIPEATYPYMVAHVRQHLAGDTGRSFELVLDLILDGLVRLGEAGSAPPVAPRPRRGRGH